MSAPIDWGDEPEQQPACGQTAPHLGHRYMLGRKTRQCEGAAASAPRGPIDWANQQAEEREQQPARHTVDTITSDALDQLYAELVDLRAQASTLAANWGYAFGLLARAVEQLPESDLRARVRAALDGRESTS